MKIETLIELAGKAVNDKDVNKCRDLLSLLEGNKGKIKQGIYSNLETNLLGVIGEKIRESKVTDKVNVIYDFSVFDSNKENWLKLWDKSLYPTFGSFFHRYLLPTFHKVPYQEIQHPIMACFALYNCAAVPNDGKKANAICTGFSRTGKSKYAERVMQLLPKKNTCTIKGNSSPKAITERIHNTCFLSGDSSDFYVKASVTRFDNIYWEDFFRRLDIHFVTLLALEKGDAICEIAGKDGGVYHTFSKYIFTTVEIPVKDTPRMDELLNRSFTFYFDKGYEPTEEPTLYNWKGFNDAYIACWDKEAVENDYFDILTDVMRIKKTNTTMGLEKLEISRTMIATGLYFDIFPDIETALRAFEDYWEFVTLKQENIGNLLFKLVTNYLNQFYYPELEYTKLKLKNKSLPDVRISFTHLQEYLLSVSNGVLRLNQKSTKEVEDIMIGHDLIIVQTNDSLQFAKRQIVNKAS